MPDAIEEESPHGEMKWSCLSASRSEAVEQEIALLEGNKFCWLRFSPVLEDYLETSSSTARSRRIWVEGIVCVILFNCFLIPDYFFSSGNFLHFVEVRVGLATPPALLALILLRRGVSKAVREGMVVFVCALFAASILYLYWNISAVVSSYAVTDLAITLLFTNIGIRLRLPYALFASTLCLGFGVVFIQLDALLTSPEKVESLGILLSAVLLSLVGNYSIERGERLNFLLRLRSEIASDVLAEANSYLLRISQEDRLTGLANRRHLDEMYEEIWRESIAKGSRMSVIMIDIDNFKILNDRYGHSYGDAVLRRVAALLKECLRVEGDFVARYGGEEFIVVLPDSSMPVALHVAQRIRLLIEIAGSPAVGERGAFDHGWATVSCGVATVLPRDGMDAINLIDVAAR